MRRSLLNRPLLILAIALCAQVQARTIEGAEFPDKITAAGGKTLLLNGAGLRIKRKLGMNFNVYAAGLYAVEKTKDASALINSVEPKVLELAFLRSLDKGTLRQAWQEGFDKNCKPDCDSAREQMKKLNDLMVDVKEKSRMKLTFEKDAVALEISGKTTSSGKVSGEAFRKAMLAVFIGSEPPTEDLKKGLLGL